MFRVQKQCPYVMVLSCGWLASVAMAAPPYVQVGEGPGPSGPFDVAPSGRIVTMIGDDLRIERAPGSGNYVTVGALTPGSISPFGASFVRVNPSGSRVAIGDNNFGNGFVYVVETAQLDGGLIEPTALALENFEATWADDDTLYVTYSNPVSFAGEVSVVDVRSGVVDLVAVVDGSAGGVGVHPSGDLLTGNGFDFAPGGSETGEIRAFASADVEAIRNGERDPFDFAHEGVFIVDLLSASSLVFDADGYLFVGGGDLFGGSGDFEYFAIADAEAVDRARQGGGPVTMTEIFRADPEWFESSTYTGRFDARTQTWIITPFGHGTVFRYRATDVLPMVDDATNQSTSFVTGLEP